MTFTYIDPVRRSYTPYRYLLPMMTCTSYSCQVTSSETTATPAPPARLTKGAVVDRALQLADAVGRPRRRPAAAALDALTIRKLATELGVTPMALYWHFRSKDELLEGLAE